MMLSQIVEQNIFYKIFTDVHSGHFIEVEYQNIFLFFMIDWCNVKIQFYFYSLWIAE